MNIVNRLTTCIAGHARKVGRKLAKLHKQTDLQEIHGPIGCSKPHQMERFMEVCLLFLLSQKIGHGYALAEQLEQFGFETEQVSVSTLYRSLRNLEKIGAVTSDWEAGGQGPQRRIYHLTQRGNELLQEWIETLRQRRMRLDRLIQSYDAQVDPI